MRTVSVVPWEALGQPPWAPPEAPSSSRLPDACEVLVVGAGITGLSAALWFAAAGRDVVVVDREFGAGAAGRSGGIVVGDTLVGPSPEFDDCDRALRDWIAVNAPECRARWAGCLELDREDHLPAAPIDWTDAGRVRLARTIDGGTIDPAALVSALGRVVVARGGRVVTPAAIERYEARGASVIAHTRDREIRAEAVLVCVDATSRADGGADPWPLRQLTIALETDVLPDRVADAMGWRDRLPFYTNELPLLWGRAMDDGAMVAGRELVPIDATADAAVVARAIDEAGARLTSRIRGLHPVLATLGIRRIWAGPIARDERGVPSIQQDRSLARVWWAGGYGGHGLAQAFRLGALAARQVSAELV